jgi:hypothetical protein
MLAAATPAGANRIVRSDGNDVAFPLDLKSVQVVHASGQQVFTIATQTAFSNAQVDGDTGWFRVGFDTGSRSFERTVYIFYASGKMRGVLTDGDGNFIRKVAAARVSANAVRVKVPTAATGSTLNYRFAVWTVWRGAPCSKKEPCLDWLPNDGTILHDLAAPAISWGDVPDPSTQTSTTLTVKIPFKVSDVGGYASGVARWTLSARPVGTVTWKVVKEGSSHGSFAVPFTGQQGLTYEFRVVAVDEQHNVRVSSRPRVTFPYDDRNDRVSYGPSEVSWVGETGVAKAFLGTRHVSAAANARLKLRFKARQGTAVCVLGAPSAAIVTADATLDGRSTADAFREKPTTSPRASIGCVDTRDDGWHTLVVAADADGLVVDGVAIG